jgi:hypothetical protein
MLSEASMTAAPGWYPTPDAAGGGSPLLRYWNGESWTEHVAPGLPPAPLTTAQPQKVEWLALVLALFPLIGILGGLISMARGKYLTGGLMLLIGSMSLVVFSVAGRA